MFSSTKRFRKRFLFAFILISILILLGFGGRYHRKIEKKIEDFCIVLSYDGENNICDSKYYDELTPEKRFLAIGFDDFRNSDFTIVNPLFAEYGAEATYNRIARDNTLSKVDIAKMDMLLNDGNEVGDHTWYHCNYIYSDPLFNGQNPDSPDGGQVPFPSNEQMRKDRGDGKNAFGFLLNESVNNQLSDWWDYSMKWSAFDNEWGELTDEQCQIIRDSFSIYKDTSGLLETFDELSNRYLGTVGNSVGSYDENSQCYQGGIFTGCKTSSNYEIWERVLEVTRLFYQDQYHEDFNFTTWSWPGSISSPFVFEKEGLRYYDEECTILYNYLARFPISTSGSEKSWTEILRDAGYYTTHDTMFPSRKDGQDLVMMRKQFIYNGFLSRNDALTYSTDRTVSYTDIAEKYPETFFDKNSRKSFAEQMYEDQGIYYQFIESIRQNTSNGMIQGEVIDSENTFSEKIFLQQVLEYCKKTGVEVISKEKAYDICFNKSIYSGNLIYNPRLRNTAKEFLPNADNVPNNPDGYIGNCTVIESEQDNPILVTQGETVYIHYGIPIGKIKYTADCLGSGTISIYVIKNSDSIELENDKLELIAQRKVSNKVFDSICMDFLIPNNPKTDYEQQCEGLGNKIMGIKIVYSSGLSIKNIDLRKDDVRS